MKFIEAYSIDYKNINQTDNACRFKNLEWKMLYHNVYLITKI